MLFPKNFPAKLILLFFLIAGTKTVFSKVDSVQIFYENHNSFFTVGLEDYKTEIKSQLGDKSKTYLEHFDVLVAACTDTKLYLRNGFWSACASYARADYPALEQAALVLFKTGMARISQRGKNYLFDQCSTSDKNFYVCNKNSEAVGGTELWLVSKGDGSLLISVPKSVTKEFLEKDWCK